MANLCYLVFFFLIIQGSLGSGFLRDCDTTNCRDLVVTRELEGIGYVPTTEEHLNRFCPPIMTSVQCGVDTIQECLGEDIVELSNSDNKTAAAFGHGVVTTKNLIIDICTPGTEMRENYLSSISCSKDVLFGPEPMIKCRRQSYAFYHTYEESKALLGNQISVEDKGSEPDCMMMAYVFACFAAEIHDTCGEVAHKTALDVLKRYQVLKWSDCTEANLRDLKTEFLDILELEEQRRSLFSSVFESMKRRK